jgi:hypothetical protein
MKRFLTQLFLLAAFSSADDAILAAPSGYKITQITSDPADHRWPSFNALGHMAWSQQVGGFWQIFLDGAPLTSGNNNYEYPAISSTGDVIYFKEGTGSGGWPPQVIKHPDSVIEFSTSNPPGCTPPDCTSWRRAGDHAGIASNGTTVSYYDFCTPSCVRRFNVSGVGQLPGNFANRDYPDINASGEIVFESGGMVYKISTTDLTPKFIAKGASPRINDSSDVVLVSDGTIQGMRQRNAPSAREASVMKWGNERKTHAWESSAAAEPCRSGATGRRI